MCILRFHARAGYLQTYETMLDQLKSLPDSDQVPHDQYDVETHALADRNFNVPCESGIRSPSLVAMLNRREMIWRPSVIIYYVYTAIYYLYTLIFTLCVQANTKHSTGCVSLDVNLLKPSRVEFLQEPSQNGFARRLPPDLK